MSGENVAEPECVGSPEPQPSAAMDDRLVDEPVRRAQAEGLQLTGEGGPLQQPAERLPASAVEGGTIDTQEASSPSPASPTPPGSAAASSVATAIRSDALTSRSARPSRNADSLPSSGHPRRHRRLAEVSASNV